MTAIGTVGLHLIEHLSWIDAFYFISMIVTAQGPVTMPATTAGKVFVSFIAFISVGSVVAALGFLLGPFLGQLFKIGVNILEDGKDRK